MKKITPQTNARIEWETSLQLAICESGECSNGDAQGLIEANDDLVDSLFAAGTPANQAAAAILNGTLAAAPVAAPKPALQTVIQKGRDGWEAKTRISLRDNMVLTIQTHKASTKEKGVCTVLEVGFLERGFVVSRPPMSPFASDAEKAECDFYLTGATHPGTCTEKAIRNAHAGALAQLDGAIRLANAHYANRAPSGLSAIEAGAEV